MAIHHAQATDDAAMHRNVRLYPWYEVTFNAFAWLPVFFLYFSRHLSLEQVLRLEALYYIAVVLTEIPSGYFSDRVGRRPTLLISAAALTAAYVLFLLGGGFHLFASAQVLLAVGMAFNSGTNTSLHYDSLAVLGQTGQYGRREAIAARNALGATALAVFIGGAAGALDLRLAYWVSLLAALATLGIAFSFREPRLRQRPHCRPPGFGRQLMLCLWLLKKPSLAWLFVFVVLMTVLNHVPHEFYQPYLNLMGAQMALSGRSTPFAAGAVMGFSMLCGSWTASRSIRLRDRIGIGPTLLLATGLQTLLISAMALWLHPGVASLILLHCIPQALMNAPLNAAVTPQVAQAQRATYLSIQWLAGRLCFSGLLFWFSWRIVKKPDIDWPSLSTMLGICALLGLAGLIGLASTARWLGAKKRRHPN